MLSGSTLLVLAAAWAIVLLPRAVRDLRTSPSTTVTGFNDAMARLAVCDQRLLVVPTGSGQRLVVAPRRPRRSVVVQRRRAVLVRLLAATAAALLLALVVGRPSTWWLAGLVTVALVGYCAALRMIALRRRDATAVVPLHPTIERRRAASADTRATDGAGSAPTVPAGSVLPAGRILDADPGLLFGEEHHERRAHARTPMLVAEGG